MRTSNTLLGVGVLAFLGACAERSGPTGPTTPSFAFSAAPCTFTTAGTTMQLDADCSTTTSIVIPNGFTLDGAHHTITGVDPVAGHFVGGVVENGGAVAHVRFLDVSVLNLADVCDAGDDRLRGIIFNSASGSITHSTVHGINQGASGCQEGNGIEVRDLDLDATASVVTISHNTVTDYQKTGIICNGNSSCTIEHNDVGASATQANLAANSIQVGFGASGRVAHNHVAGNQWCGPSNTVATAILLFQAAGPQTVVESNTIDGNSDVGIDLEDVNGASVSKNKVSDEGTDCNAFGYDYGIIDFGANYPNPSNSLTKNKVSGFDTPYDPANPGGKNKVKKAHGSPG